MGRVVDYDVVVVGGGPSGAMTARTCAEAGLRTLLVDKKQELGSPVQCSGAISGPAMHEVGVVPDEEFVLCEIGGFVVHGPAGAHTTLDYRVFVDSIGYVVDRRRFDRALTSSAEKAGADTWLKTEAAGFTTNDDDTITVELSRFGVPVQVRAAVLVGADGIRSQVGRWAGIRTHTSLANLGSCAQYVLDGVEDSPFLEIAIDSRLAPGGYGWLFPKGHGRAEIGVGIFRNVTDRDARSHLDEFLSDSVFADRVKSSRIIEIQGGGVPAGPPLKQQSTDHVLLVGDSARQVNPFTYGGLATALRGGVLAGKFLAEFLPTGQPATAAALAEYHRRWLEAMGNTMWTLYGIKRDISRQSEPGTWDRVEYEAWCAYFTPGSPYLNV